MHKFIIAIIIVSSDDRTVRSNEPSDYRNNGPSDYRASD